MGGQMRKYLVIYVDGGQEYTHYVHANNSSSARLLFKSKFPAVKIISVGVFVPNEVKLLQEAATAGSIRVGVQKSMQLGYSDLPLFQKDEQLGLF
jgi:hypothetical protein